MEIEVHRQYTKEERLNLIRLMIEHKMRNKITWEKLADKFRINRRTVQRWRETEEWRIEEGRWRQILQSEARTELHEATQDAIGVLQDLMHDVNVSAFTRFNCAKTIIELTGIAEAPDEIGQEQHGELLQFLQEAGDRPSVVATVLDVEVKPGGFLPDQITEIIQEQGALVRNVRPQEPHHGTE